MYTIRDSRWYGMISILRLVITGHQYSTQNGSKEKNKKKATVELVPLLVLVEVPMFAQHQLWALDGMLVSAIS